ncbi:hypothetical protein KJZ71_04270 [Patescibacteria group bacterium]|uniref:Uncharacterized protein n=1 Tax=candidate division WWE3 bacterium TaxID=2053526 RepID=A0A928TTY5_UNCKA|nr:hypothetical protein [candidate division WWE3 bacterium]MCL4732987.1 hypothetical protein [Patescibacteria group bacterium]
MKTALQRAILFGTSLFFLPRTALAQGQSFVDRIRSGVNTAGAPAGLTQSAPLEVLIGNLINAALGFVGVVLLGVLLYAGFLWMTAGGNVDQVKKAKAMITNSVVGLVIVAASFAIANFVLGAITGATTGGGGAQTSP